MKWKYCNYCPLDGTCENQDRGRECEMPVKKLLEENQQLNKRLLDMIDLLQKCYFYLNAVTDGKVKTEHLEQIKTLAVLIDNAIGEKK